MRIILSSNPYRDRGLRTALEADRILRKAGAETVLCLPFVPKKGERLDLPRQAALHKLEEELPKADLLVCFGGDGTILHAARDATLHGVPILGVNMGSVGFMAELERTELSLLVPLAKGSLCDGGADDAGHPAASGGETDQPGPGPERCGLFQGLHGPGGGGGGTGPTR